MVMIMTLTACSDSDVGTTGTTTDSGTAVGTSVVGTLAGFGSIIMSNGVMYNTDSVSSCEVDDTEIAGKCEDSLDVGMNISMQVDTSNTVTSVHYDDDLEGPASGVSGADGNYSFKVMGINVTAASPDTQWEDFSANPPLADELNGANVEVSGEWQDDVLVASYIEKQSDSDETYEAEGLVGIVNDAAFTLSVGGGSDIAVDASRANLIPQQGDYIEVEGSLDGGTLIAFRIELEDEDDFDNDGDAEITGTLMQDSDSTSGYSIGNTSTDISNAPGCNDLIGSIVEAEGSYDQTAGVLVVDECEDESDELEMKCQVSNVTTDVTLPKVGTLDCDFPGTTGGPLRIEFRDSPELAEFTNDDSIDHFDLTDVSAGDCVEIKASLDGAGALVAGLLELEDVATGCDSYELHGPLDAITADAITELGIAFTVDADTEYPGGIPVVGNNVEVKDVDADGSADYVEISDVE
jgi:hypothetical protein